MGGPVVVVAGGGWPGGGPFPRRAQTSLNIPSDTGTNQTHPNWSAVVPGLLTGLAIFAPLRPFPPVICSVPRVILSSCISSLFEVPAITHAPAAARIARQRS